MGNNSKPSVVERKKNKKKKGRPSLVEIQKRSLRLQQQDQLKQNPNRNPNSSSPPNSYHLHQPSSSGRRMTRRNPNSDPSSSGEASAASSLDEDDDGSSDRRREKKIKLVHRLPSSDTDIYPKDEGNRSKKETDSQQEDALELGPATPLPNKKTLESMLDRLQKKDSHGVYSEPVDPEELPDYHDIIEHPMDFSTVRKKLSSGTYKSLEQFEKDVFLISSNAMKYNAPDTIYFRQAKAIQELAKKNFENLRQDGDGTEQQLPKPAARRGRPPNKNKKPAVKPSSEDTAPDGTFYAPKPTNNSVDENNSRSSTCDIKKLATVPEKPAVIDNFRWINDQRTESDAELSSSVLKGLSAKCGSGKKQGVSDENRRKTYKLSQLSTSYDEFPIPSTFDQERKLLVPVGIQVEHAYARSIARFAAKLGPEGWAIAAKKIERVLPPGMKFGQGWVIDGEPTQKPQKSIPSPDNMLTHLKVPSPPEVKRTRRSEDHSANQSTLPDTSRSGTSGTTSSSADNNNFSEDDQPKALSQPTINGFCRPQNYTMQNLAKAVVPHGQAFSMIHSSNNISSVVINQRHMLNLAKPDLVAPDLNVGFQQLGPPSSKTGSRVEPQQQPNLALQL